jgi:hypothetical protein
VGLALRNVPALQRKNPIGHVEIRKSVRNRQDRHLPALLCERSQDAPLEPKVDRVRCLIENQYSRPSQ